MTVGKSDTTTKIISLFDRICYCCYSADMEVMGEVCGQHLRFCPNCGFRYWDQLSGVDDDYGYHTE